MSRHQHRRSANVSLTVSDRKTPRILIVRLSAIGDVMHGLPVACALRTAFPGAFLAWMVEGRAGDLLEGHDALDAVVRVPRKWLKSPAVVRSVWRRLRSLRIEVALDVQGLTKSAIASWLSGAPQRIGFAGRDGRELSCWLNNQRVEATATHVIERNLELLRPLGVENPRVEFRLPEPADAACQIEQYLQEAELTGGFALINPGAGWPSKLWPTDRFALVARHVGDAHGLPTIIVWAGDDERQMAEQIAAGSRGQARLAPATTLPELASLARRARLAVASDTGPLHVAAAVGTPCVGLFGPMPHERNGPYGPQHVALQEARLDGSSRERRRASNATMQAIEAAQVCAACDAILARGNREAEVTRVA